jgi:hypothetical protein
MSADVRQQRRAMLVQHETEAAMARKEAEACRTMAERVRSSFPRSVAEEP